MTRYYGELGYADLVETSPGVWEEVFTERPYFGDVTRMSRLLRESQGVNDNVVISNTISVVADAYAYEHIHALRYARMEGAKWRIQTVEVHRPRLILYLGEVYNA